MDKLGQLFSDSNSPDLLVRDKAVRELAGLFTDMTKTNGWQVLVYYIYALVENAKQSLVNVDLSDISKATILQQRVQVPMEVYRYVTDTIKRGEEIVEREIQRKNSERGKDNVQPQPR